MGYREGGLYFNSSLSKQFIELDLQDERHTYYCYKKEMNVLKLRLDLQDKGSDA